MMKINNMDLATWLLLKLASEVSATKHPLAFRVPIAIYAATPPWPLRCSLKQMPIYGADGHRQPGLEV